MNVTGATSEKTPFVVGVSHGGGGDGSCLVFTYAPNTSLRGNSLLPVKNALKDKNILKKVNRSTTSLTLRGASCAF